MLSNRNGRTLALAAGVALMASAAHAGEVAGGVIGCDAAGHKQVAGAVIGGVLGGVIGNNVIKKDQQAGTIVGATAGAAAGSYVGCQMQKKDAREPASSASSARARPYVADDRGDEPAYRYRTRDDWNDDGPAYGRRGVPPGLSRKPYGMPPGQAKKIYGVGERMPIAFVSDRRNYIREPARYSLRAPRRATAG